ncbi:ABC transporter substrate-binding protein [Streptomyces sp. NPDC002888]|uniref:ABC transporter substrate-binding protein n=1 Tax=Streptomyces sp. NPDC002888 TaxID=3364668 RepID=UPI0036982F2C
MTTDRARPTFSRRSAIATVALLALSATACAGAGTDGETGKAKVTDKDIASFTVAMPSQMPGFDRAISAQPYVTGSVMSLVTEPLERVGDDGNYTPVLAEKVTQPDAATVVYTLREGVKFSDGQDLTAEDVAWSITHTAAPPAQTSASVRGFKSASVSGPREVTVKFSYGAPAARETIANATLIQEKAFATAHKSNLGTTKAIPVGTGPYQVQSTSASGVVLERRKSYWGTKPKVQTLNFKTIPDDNSAQLAMRSGEVNMRRLTNVKTAGQWRGIDGTTVVSAPSGSLNFLAMDVTKAPFDDIHVRQAISHSVDVPGVIKAAWGGEASALQGLLPLSSLSDVAGGQKTAQSYLDSLPDHNFDLEKAKAELAKSAHPDGFSTTVQYVNEVPYTKVLALSLQENLKQLGIDVKVKATTLNAWSAQFYQHKLTGLTLGFGFTADTHDPSNPLGAMVGKENIGPQKANLANFTTPQVEKALPVLSAAGADAARWKATTTILSQIAEQAAYVPLASEDVLVAFGKGYVSVTGKATTADIGNGAWLLNIRATQQ